MGTPDQDDIQIVRKILDLLVERTNQYNTEVLALYSQLTDKFFTKNQNKIENNLLHEAARYDSAELVKAMVQQEISFQPQNVKKLSARLNEQGAIPLYVAIAQETINTEVVDALFKVSDNDIMALIKFYNNYEKRHQEFDGIQLNKGGRPLLGVMIARLLMANDRADKKIKLPNPEDYIQDAMVYGAENLQVLERIYEQYQNKAIEKIALQLFDHYKDSLQILDFKLAASRISKNIRENITKQINKNSFKQEAFKDQIGFEEIVVECMAYFEKNNSFAQIAKAADQVSATADALWNFIIGKFYQVPKAIPKEDKAESQNTKASEDSSKAKSALSKIANQFRLLIR